MHSGNQILPIAPVGPDLQAARSRAGITREQLAVRAGISATTIERIEHGRVVPRRGTMILLGIALATSPTTNDEGAPAEDPFAKNGEDAPRVRL